MKLTWFGHSAFRIDYAGAVILLDPFIANPTFKGDVEATYAGATHVLVTHGHGDHTGIAADICKATGATLVSNPEICGYLGKQGVAKAEPINHGGELHFGSFSVAYVPAWHSSSADDLTYLGNPGGFVLMAEGEKTVLAMGDTGIFDGMKLIGEIYAPQIGLVPIGDRFTMGGRIAALACTRFFDFETVVPCHYGTFGLIDATPDKFIAGMKGAKAKVLVPERGKAVML
jgi:L-ascorbate metabolism protein UlaG (beta-lactamase superfamily)